MQAKHEDIEYCKVLSEKYKMKSRHENLLVQMQDLMERANMLDYAYVNEDLFNRAIVSYFEDIDRLKSFEGIDRINVEKIHAYETFWLLRMKPIQIKNADALMASPFLNEKIVCGMLLAKMLNECDIEFDDENPRIQHYMELMFYSFKYREFTPKTLELMISAFFCGCCYKPSGQCVTGRLF